MTWQVAFEAPAQAEIAEAFAWYERQSYGLGGDFLRMLAASEEQRTRRLSRLRAAVSAAS